MDNATNDMLPLGFMIGFLSVLLLTAVAMWKIYSKAGEAGWKSLIPIYNTFVFQRIVGRPAWWVLLMLVPVVNIVLAMIECSARAWATPSASCCSVRSTSWRSGSARPPTSVRTFRRRRRRRCNRRCGTAGPRSAAALQSLDSRRAVGSNPAARRAFARRFTGAPRSAIFPAFG